MPCSWRWSCCAGSGCGSTSRAGRGNGMDDDEEQMDLFPEDKAHARRSDPHTSHDAADSVEHIRRSQQDVLMVLRRFGPMHDDGLWRVITSLFGKGVLPMS